MTLTMISFVYIVIMELEFTTPD